MKKYMFDGIQGETFRIKELDGELVGDAFVVDGARLSPKGVFDTPEKARDAEIARRQRVFAMAKTSMDKAKEAHDSAFNARVEVTPWR